MIKTISSFFKKHSLTPIVILKLTGVVVLAIVVLSIAFDMMGFSMNPSSRMKISQGGMGGSGVFSTAPMPPEFNGYGYADTLYPPTFPPDVFPGSTGNTAEDFEVTEYNASIETRDTEKTCAEITDLKVLSYVIFESASEYDTGCAYTFKVEHARAPEILSRLEALDPKRISENTYTIKRQVDDFTSESEILESKKKSLDETLDSALRAYDEITRLATRTEDTETLAKIINSKIQLIERLTSERINVSSQLERLARSKSEQLDRLEYTFFHVDAYESVYVDWEGLGDSWKNALRNLVATVNRALQDATVNLLAGLVALAPYAFYILIFLVVIKYAWKVLVRTWKQ